MPVSVISLTFFSIVHQSSARAKQQRTVSLEWYTSVVLQLWHCSLHLSPYHSIFILCLIMLQTNKDTWFEPFLLPNIMKTKLSELTSPHRPLSSWIETFLPIHAYTPHIRTGYVTHIISHPWLQCEHVSTY